MSGIVQFWWKWRFNSGFYVAEMFRLLREKGLLLEHPLYNKLVISYSILNLIRLPIGIMRIEYWSDLDPAHRFLKTQDPEDRFIDDVNKVLIFTHLFCVGLNMLIISIGPDFFGWKLFSEQTTDVHDNYLECLKPEAATEVALKNRFTTMKSELLARNSRIRALDQWAPWLVDGCFRRYSNYQAIYEHLDQVRLEKYLRVKLTTCPHASAELKLSILRRYLKIENIVLCMVSTSDVLILLMAGRLTYTVLLWIETPIEYLMVPFDGGFTFLITMFIIRFGVFAGTMSSMALHLNTHHVRNTSRPVELQLNENRPIQHLKPLQRFLREHMRISLHIQYTNRKLFGHMMLVALGLHYPANFNFAVKLLTEKRLEPFTYFALSAVTYSHLVTVTAVPWMLASYVGEMHRSRLFIPKLQFWLENKRLKLKYMTMFERVNVGKRKYGITIGPLRTITHSVCFEIVLIYVGYVLNSLQLIYTVTDETEPQNQQ